MESPKVIWSWQEVIDSKEESVPFLIEPYIPEEGIVLLHGKSSLGKSPLIWNMGLAVASGLPLWGLPTKQGSVVYLEVDGPGVLVRPRMKLLSDLYPANLPLSVSFLAGKVDILNPRPEIIRELQSLQIQHSPVLVIINTLRKVFKVNANDSEVPSKVYDAFRYFFPQAALLFVHHDRKTSRDADSVSVEAEDLAGSLAWKNDAQVALHLRKNGRTPGHLRLDHTKSQVSELYDPLMLKLDEDGTHLFPLHEERLREVGNILRSLDPVLSSREKDFRIAAFLNCSERTARKRRLEWEEEIGKNA